MPHMKKYLDNGSYLSHQITSELIELMYRDVVKDIIGEVKEAKFFAIVIDETTDITG